MKLATCLLVLPLTLLPAAAGGPKDGPAAKELAKLQGTWKRVSIEIDGQKAPEDRLAGSALTIKGDHYSLKQGGQTRTGTLKLDPSKSPKQIDIISGEGPNKGKSLHGIYEIQGDTFRYCIDMRGGARPAEFSSKAGTGHGLFVNRRVKP